MWVEKTVSVSGLRGGASWARSSEKQSGANFTVLVGEQGLAGACGWQSSADYS